MHLAENVICTDQVGSALVRITIALELSDGDRSHASRLRVEHALVEHVRAPLGNPSAVTEVLRNTKRSARQIIVYLRD